MSADTHAGPAVHWVTLDCDGTRADWIAGIQSELTRLFGTQQSARLLGRHHDFEPRARARPIRAGEQPDLLGLGEPVH